MLRALFFVLIFIPWPASAGVQIYDRVKVREQLLAIRDQNHAIETQVRGYFTSMQAASFVQFYTSVVVPAYQKRVDHFYKSHPLRILLDSASYDSIEERDAWIAELKTLNEKANALEADPEWARILKTWAQLAQGLTGRLPDEARKAVDDNGRLAFGPALLPLTDELDAIMARVHQAQNEVPATLAKDEFELGMLENLRQFKAGEIGFTEASEYITRAVRTGGQRHIGKQVVDRTGQDLNRAAVIRSHLAKAKGFNSWAAYRLEDQKEGHTAEYSSAETQKALLYKILTALRPAAIKYYDGMIAQLGLDPAKVMQEHVGLLFKDDLLQIRKFYPGSELSRIWEANLIASGFPDEVLSQIIVDDQVREGKNVNDAYQTAIVASAPKIEIIDAATLDYVWPEDSSGWRPALVYILQNYTNGGVGNLSVAFHEGGHGTENVTKFKTSIDDTAYGYKETPSTTMEHFVDDAQVLYHYAVPVDGERPSLEQIETLLANERETKLLELQGTSSNALFDLELWDYDYSAPGAQTFLERARFLYSELALLKGHRRNVDAPIEAFYRDLAHSHFVSGDVRYIGYVYAQVSSAMMIDFISDTLEETTGRRSWYNQPTLASIFIGKFFQQGWKEAFPTNIESITGRKFDPEQVVRNLLGTDCDASLTGK